jgi:hypothetical protein
MPFVIIWRGLLDQVKNNFEGFTLKRRYNFFYGHLAEAEEGALLPSPTREKLMPTIPRSKGDSPQRGSPSKSASSKLESPKKGSPLKSPKKTSQGLHGFSQNLRSSLSEVSQNFFLFSCSPVTIGWPNGARRLTKKTNSFRKLSYCRHRFVPSENAQKVKRHNTVVDCCAR